MKKKEKLDYSFVEMLSKRETDINQHLPTLYNLVVENKYKVVVELGAGQSTYVFTAAVNKTKGRFISIDLDPKAHLRGFGEGEGVLEKERRYRFIRGDDLKIVKKWRRKIDLLFIDTSHTYEHTIKELKKWEPFVKVGGKIVLHDTYHKLGHAVGVRPALGEFLAKNKNRFAVQHIEHRGGLSIVDKLKK